MKNMYPTMQCGKDKLLTVVEGNITNELKKFLQITEWLQGYHKLVKDLEEAIEEQ